MGDTGGSSSSGVKENSLMWPMLTRSNYMEWTMLMQCNYEAMEIWYAIDPGTNPKRAHDCQAMSTLMRSVPSEMWQMLGNRKTMKEAWEVVRTMRLGADRVKDVNAQKLLQEFENIKFKDGETIDDFGMRITNLISNLKSLGETMEDTRVVKKFLRVVPAHGGARGRLRAAEERFDDKIDNITDKAGRLLLAEEDWLEKNQHRLCTAQKEGDGSGGSTQAKNKQPAACPEGGGAGGVKLTSMGMPRRKGWCRNCGIYGHWAEDCKRPPKKDKKKEGQPAEVNMAVGHETGTLMLAMCDVVHGSHQFVHLMKKVIPVDVPNNVWVLDIGASNHMTGTRSALS
ncbi:uncharacterized protein [Miscanthus floridulus]|uniref:uncharacterized protein n=1 Tax=Miscanthus floridulus TaxID=154761 RepID=UPI00345B01EB